LQYVLYKILCLVLQIKLQFLYLCNYLNIPIEQTIACGDSENDLDIMRAAGLGIAMANAPEDIRKQADDITLDNNHHGVAAFLKKWI